MAYFGVAPEKEAKLKQMMSRFAIKEDDIIEHFVRSGGPGGQNVNKTSTTVYLKHIPSNIEVKCSSERSQVLNRYFARRILIEKIETMLLGEKSRHIQKIEKIRRQKRKRSKRAKEKMLRDKKIHSEKKQARKNIAIQTP